MLSLLSGPVEHTGNGIDTQTLRGVVVTNQKIASTTTVIEISMYALNLSDLTFNITLIVLKMPKNMHVSVNRRYLHKSLKLL